MTTDAKPRVKLPKSAKPGDVVTIKTLINHQMESGQRRDASGAVIPRKIINRFTCTFNGETVIDVALEPSVSTNPYLEFDAVVDGAGEFTFTWTDDDGTVITSTETIGAG